MAMRIRRNGGNGLDAWPGYVDALSTLLMVIIFVLLVFVLAQGFLSAALSGRNQALESARRELTELRNALSMEQTRAEALQGSVTRLKTDLDGSAAARATLAQQLAALRDRAASLTQDRDRLTGSVADATLAFQAAVVANERLQAQLAEAIGKLDASARETAALRERLATADQQVDAANRRIADLEPLQGRLAAATARAEAAQRDTAAVETRLTATRDELTVELAAARATLEALQRQIAELTPLRDRLAETSRRADLSARDLDAAKAELARTLTELAAARQRQEALLRQIAELTPLRDRLAETVRRADLSARDLDAAKAELARTLNELAAARQRQEEMQRQIAELTPLRDRLAESSRRVELSARDLDAAKAELARTLTELAAARQRQEEMQRQIADLDRTVKADKETIEARLADLARLTEQARALAALRDELERQARELLARANQERDRRVTAETALAEQTRLGESARAEVALLNRQIEELRAQLSAIARGLELEQQTGREKDTEIADLGQKLNAALVNKVEELQQYRSEFFGRLRTVLQNRTGIQVVGDRFVFQSEVLFPVGSAELTQAGVAQMTPLAITIKEIAAEIPSDVRWLLRVDGHTDPLPVARGGYFASNWELSAARAITVVKLLISFGVPADRLAATGFGEFQPFGPGDTTDAYARSRRIELRLTDR